MAGALLLYCRPGFERECAQEITSAASIMGAEGFVKAKPESGYAVFTAHQEQMGRDLGKHIDFAALVFARQAIRNAELIGDLATGDRVAPILAAALRQGRRFRELVLEMPDTNDGKALSSLTKPLAPHLGKALAKAGVVVDDPEAEDRLHVFFIGSTACYVGVAACDNSSPWPQGIPRLRMPRGAPSRSTLKLAEAIHVFLGETEAKKAFVPGMTAIDLGASPGGWSWQLASRGLTVIAVDNGPIDEAVLATGQVKHRRTDGFRYRPEEPVDWMVCDMVEQPSRVATLAAQWIAEGWCRASIFNLKLPMKRRWEEVERAQSIVAEALGTQPHELRMKQLYHDREEVTAHLAVARRSR
ncbi:23S rRNA (cytidine(2498)-2'-O)-methyltransferase RlmM [Usitatibacter palustris]|uniref:Ribosomal RNA large subunit methyltransferase M n=1 Tax=Usitatibacter palustris TaxID=2732487 RepID=A0A6M4H8R3_9PROT|nr:23S rRNA (cytidine(2498)-2'-O)-methyltransferase RlmM [Usitatibacter palustris]QJR15198.1 Ribosomal RNA large subunit methyltransferase M [Usitatibacter palustris]